VGDAAVEAVANRVTFFASGFAKATLQTVQGSVENAVASIGGQFAQNLVTSAVDKNLSFKGMVSGMGWNALMGFGTGALGSVAEAGLGRLVTGEVSASTWSETGLSRSNNEAYDEMVEVMQRHGIDPDSGPPGHTFEFKDVDMHAGRNLLVSVSPDALITWAADGALTSVPSWPQW